METITFECEVITPMFLAGADGSTPELRPPSIKGAMRFWWRAMNGHLVNNTLSDPYKPLRDAESEIFGGSEGDGKKSSFSIRVFFDKEFIFKNKSYEKLVPHKNISQYCILPNNNDTFEVKLTTNNNLEFLENLFILTCILGGLGKRSRRGMGCFKIKTIKKNDGRKEEFIFKGIDDLQSIISKCNKRNDKLLYIINNNEVFNCNCIQLNDSNTYSYEYPYLKQIIFTQLKENQFSNFVTKVSKSSGNSTFSLKYLIEENNKVVDNIKFRLASPIYISTCISSDNNNFVVISLLNESFKDSTIDNTKRKTIDTQNTAFIKEVLNGKK